MQDICDFRKNILGLAHAARAGIAASQEAALRADEADAALTQQLHVFPGSGVLPHASIHGGGHQHRRFRRQHSGGQHIVGDAVGHLRQDVGGGRGDHKHVRPLRQGDVLHLPGFGAGEGVRHRGMIAEGFKGQRRDELAGVLRHNDVHLRPGLAQAGNKLARLIGGDASRHAQHHVFSFQRRHVIPLRLPGCGGTSAGPG